MCLSSPTFISPRFRTLGNGVRACYCILLLTSKYQNRRINNNGNTERVSGDVRREELRVEMDESAEEDVGKKLRKDRKPAA